MRGPRYIRFDYAIKRLLRHKADFVVVEGFLSSLLGEDIKILEVLESEGNQKNARDKFNRVDILVKDSSKRKIIVEIQNTFQVDFFQRMLYGTSKVVTEHIKLGDEYGMIGKVISVNIVYFPLGKGDDYVYHGKTAFTGIHKGDTLQLSEKQKAVFSGGEAGDLFPEYYVLRVEDFDKKAKTPLDEWIHFLKTSEIPKTFSAPGLAPARERLAETTMTARQLHAYERYYKGLSIANSEAKSAFIDGHFKGHAEGLLEGKAEGLAEGKAEGLAEGKAEGKAEGASEIAMKLLGKGMPPAEVLDITGLPLLEIEAIAKRMRDT